MTVKKKQASEAREETEIEVSTSASEVVTLTLDEYLKGANPKINEGLVASFKVEAANEPSALEPKSSDEWAQAFSVQSNRIYT